MGLFSRKSASQESATRPRPEPASANPERIALAKDFMAEWTGIVGQATDPVFRDALARFGQIGDAVQEPNTPSGNANLDVRHKRH